jgi:hypothetical protein
VWTGHVELITAVHRLAISIVANEPPQGRYPLGYGLDIDNPFDDSTHIVSIANDLMEVKGLLPRVAPDRAGIGMTGIFGQIIQTHAASAQQGQASTPSAMTGDASSGIR